MMPWTVSERRRRLIRWELPMSCSGRETGDTCFDYSLGRVGFVPRYCNWAPWSLCHWRRRNCPGFCAAVCGNVAAFHSEVW